MAFSTQREFMEVGFMNEHLEAVCARKPDVKLKTYFSNTDTRAWAMNDKKQANFLADLVACRTYIKDEGEPRPYTGLAETSKDSLLFYAKEKLEALDTIAAENNKLRDELEISDERLKIVNDENDKLKGILDEDVDNPLGQKIRALRGKTLTPKDEKDLMMSLKILITRDKAVRALEAENFSLRRIIEKLSKRAKYSDVTKEGGGVKEETSTDVDYLQKTVNDLKKEVAILQDVENDYNKCKIEYDALKLKFTARPGFKKHYGQREPDPNRSVYAHDTANNILVDGSGEATAPRDISIDEDTPFARVIEERDLLRKQLARMIGLEDKISALRERAMVADSLEKELTTVKKKQAKMDRGSINNMAKMNAEKAEMEGKLSQMANMEADNEELKKKLANAQNDAHQLRDSQIALKCLQLKNANLMEELKMAGCQLKRMKCIEQKLKVTENQLCRNERIIQNYECQFNQLMMVIEELEGCPKSPKKACSNTSTQALVPNDFHLRDLTLATKATLEQMKLELKARGILQIAVEDGQNEVNLVKKRCQDEMQCCVRNCDAKCSDLMCQLEACRKNNCELKQALQKVIAELLPESDASCTDDKKLCEQLSKCCCEETKRIKKELSSESQKHIKEKCELEKKVKEIEKLQDKLEEETDKYVVQRERSKALLKEKNALKSQQDCLQSKLSESNEQFIKQQKLLDEQSSLLSSSNHKLSEFKKQMDKCNEKLSELECTVSTLTMNNENYEKRVKDDENQIQMLQCKIKELSSCIDECEVNTDGGKSSQDELSNLKKSLMQANSELAVKDAALKEAIAKAESATSEIDSVKSELNGKICKLKSKNQSLEKEIKKNQTEMGEMMKLVGEIETERDKNTELGCLVESFDQQLNSVTKMLPTTDENLIEVVETLKCKLEMEEKQRNELCNALKKANAELKANKKAKGSPTKGKIDTNNLISSSDVKKQVRNIEKKNSQGLLRLQSIHDDQMKDVLKNHEKEIHSLKLSNRALRESFTKLKTLTPGCENNKDEIRRVLCEIKEGLCTCKNKQMYELTKLQKICQRIIDLGIECITAKELTTLHGEVYQAGLRLKPELLKVTDEKQKCCKCTDFSCCLPNISKDMEKRLISRIVFLETEVEKANKILMYLKKKHSNELVEWTFNDELSEFFKSLSTDNQCKKKNNLIVSDSSRKCKTARQCTKKRRFCDRPMRDIP